MDAEAGMTGNLIIFTSSFIIIVGFIVSAWFAGFRKFSLLIQLFLIQVILSFFFLVVISTIVPKNVINDILSSFTSAYASAWLLLKYKKDELFIKSK
jgi:hypothetical protein